MDVKSSFSHKSSEPVSGFLYIVGTPIGNLSDISFRAVNILKKVSLIACEDTRQTKKILSKFEFSNYLISFNKFNSFNKIPKIIDDLKSGKSIALVSDAGMPGICDPGEELIKEAKNNGIQIICIPGPSAALTALVSSGFPSSKFSFIGFLPKKKKEREKLFLEIKKSEKTIISFLAKTSISAIGYKINIGVKIDKITTLSYFKFFKKLYKRKKYNEYVKHCIKNIVHLNSELKNLENSIAS